MAIRAWVRRHPALTGVLLIYALTWPIDLALAAQSRGLLPFVVPEYLGLLVGYGFVAAALIATALEGGWAAIGALLRRYLFWRVRWFWWAIALLGPAAAVLAALALDRLMGGPPADFANPFARNFMPAGLPLWGIVLGWFVFEAFTNGEEIGWRGHLLPRLLQRHSALVAALIVGLLWTAWHLPKFLLGGTVGSAHDYPFWIFALHTMAFSVLITWVFQHTRGSLLVATAFHAAGNTATMSLPITAGTRAFLIMVVIMALWAAGVVLFTGRDLRRASR